MPLYMDVHNIDGGVAADDVAKAHMADLQAQAAHDVQYLRYWVDEKQGKIRFFQYFFDTAGVMEAWRNRH